MSRGVKNDDLFSANYKTHLRNVYYDQEFYNDIASTPEKLKKKYPYIKTIKPKSIESKYYKPKVLKNPSLIDISKKYRISMADIIMFAKGQYDSELSTRPEGIELNSDTLGNYVIRFSQNITRSDFMNIWKDIQHEKKSNLAANTRDPDLIYAIFKAREHRLVPLTFDEISLLLMHNKLPFYSGDRKVKKSTTDWNQWMSLARLYKRNEPKIKQK